MQLYSSAIHEKEKILPKNKILCALYLRVRKITIIWIENSFFFSWVLHIVLSLFKRQCFGDWVLSIFRWNMKAIGSSLHDMSIFPETIMLLVLTTQRRLDQMLHRCVVWTMKARGTNFEIFFIHTNNNNNNNNNNNSMALVREWTIPTERPPLAVEVSANFCGCILKILTRYKLRNIFIHTNNNNNNNNNNNSMGLVSELYRLSDRRLPSKLVPTFADVY
jgi:hypothetical protein